MNALTFSALVVKIYPAFLDLVEESGFDREKISINSYSGRFMYGDSCAAIYLPEGVVATSFMSLFVRATFATVTEKEIQNEFLNLSAKLFLDCMGKGTVVYWKDMAFPTEDALREFEELIEIFE